MPWDPESWNLSLHEDADRGMPAQNVFHWSAVDETTDGKVRYFTMVDVDGPTPPDVAQDVWRRVFCFYIVGHLSGKPLADACHSLADIYSWQLDQARLALQIPEQKRHTVSQVRQVDKVPFTFDED